MPSVAEEVTRIHWLIKAGKITAEDRCTPLVVPRIATKDRIKRAKAEGKTRLIKQLDTPETYEGFEGEFGRYKDITGNPQIAFKLMLDVLGAPSDEQIRKAAEEGQ